MSTSESSQTDPSPLDQLTDDIAAASLQDEASQTDLVDNEKRTPSPRPLRIYNRSQILHLSNSPLVKPPLDMPEMKDWFGYVYTWYNAAMFIHCWTVAASRMNRFFTRKTLNLQLPTMQETDGQY